MRQCECMVYDYEIQTASPSSKTELHMAKLFVHY
jgi:hypothetical protein